MIPDDPAQRRSPDQPLPDGDPGAGAEGSSRGRSVVLVLAVTFAAIGFLSLVAILLTAALGGTVWPGFVVATYFCLPIAFLLMASLVIWMVVSRRGS